MALHAGWTDQEVADLLVAHRRAPGAPLKLRLDYYRRTIATAHAALERVTARDARFEAIVATALGFGA